MTGSKCDPRAWSWGGPGCHLSADTGATARPLLDTGTWGQRLCWPHATDTGRDSPRGSSPSSPGPSAPAFAGAGSGRGYPGYPSGPGPLAPAGWIAAFTEGRRFWKRGPLPQIAHVCHPFCVQAPDASRTGRMCGLFCCPKMARRYIILAAEERL